MTGVQTCALPIFHNGARYFPEAADALTRFRARGGTVILVTNAPTTEAGVVARLDRLGVPRTAFDRVATSGDVTAAAIVDAGCPPLFTIGPADDAAIYREAASLGPRTPALVDADTAELAVCVGLDETGPKPEDYDGILHRLRARDLTLICANPDLVVEMGDTLVFCAGAIAERYAALGGRILYAGKPREAIYARARALACDASGRPGTKARTLAIGDAMRTDIAGAVAEGIRSVLITGGIHRARLHAAGSPDFSEAAVAQFLGEHEVRPDALMPSLTW